MRKGPLKRLSLNLQLFLAMMLLIFGFVAVMIFVNSRYLVRFYQYNKREQMLESFHTIYEASEDGKLEEDSFDIPFEKIASEYNISMFILNPDDRTIIRSSMNEIQNYQMELFEVLMQPNHSNISILDDGDNYILLRKNDERMGSDYLIISGTLANGDIIYMRTALESIRESAAITNRFFTMIGLALVLISGIFSFFLAKTISRPISELTDVSQKMAELDFEVKYRGNPGTAKEIDELGYHINQLSNTLESTISELKVANNELQQDIKKKEEIDEMRKEFLSNVSHELKTPIALISGYAEGLQECINDDPESRDFYCDVIMDEADKMNTMVKKLLTLNQLEFGNDTVDMERFDMTELIRGVREANILLACQDNITIDFLENEPLYVWADAFKTEEVITNYLTNAIHYALGEKRVTISYTKHDKIVRVSVFNTGNQIPEDELEKVWIKFYKVDKARTREYGGSGIGLSIVKAIMDSMHQKCGVINHEDGVEFWMELEMA